MCVCVDTYACVDVHFSPKGTSKGVPFRSRPQRLQWAGQTGRQPPANDQWVCCSLAFRPRSPAADWAQWAMKSRSLDLSLQGAFAQAIPLVVLAQTVRLALQARAFSVLLSSFFCLKCQIVTVVTTPHPQTLPPLCLTAVLLMCFLHI